jgi:hypothetical protein
MYKRIIITRIKLEHASIIKKLALILNMSERLAFVSIC